MESVAEIVHTSGWDLRGVVGDAPDNLHAWKGSVGASPLAADAKATNQHPDPPPRGCHPGRSQPQISGEPDNLLSWRVGWHARKVLGVSRGGDPSISLSKRCFTKQMQPKTMQTVHGWWEKKRTNKLFQSVGKVESVLPFSLSQDRGYGVCVKFARTVGVTSRATHFSTGH